PVRYIAERLSGQGWKALGYGINNIVLAIAANEDDVYVGGYFTKTGGIYANNIAQWNGYSWEALDSGINDGVKTIAVSGNDVYAGGEFTEAGGSPASNIARWDGSSWSPLGSGVNRDVWAIAISGSDVYIGGDFSQAGGSPANGIVKWDGSTWSPLGEGVNGRVQAIAVSGNDVYAVGNFTEAGGSPANRIAKWDGSSWSPLGDGIIGWVVDAIAISGNDVYVGGGITQAGGIPVDNIAKWNGINWSVLGSGINGSDVRAIVVSGNDVYAGGQFYEAGGIPASNIARWDGSNWSNIGSGVNSVLSALSVSENHIYAGGYFWQAGGKNSEHFGIYSISAPSFQPTNPNFSNVTSSSFSVSFTAGTDLADRYIAVRREGVSPTFVPQDGTLYTNGQIVGDGIVAYVGNDVTFHEMNLNPGTHYYYNIFSFNGSGPSSVYLTVSPLETSQTTLATQPIAQPTNISFSSVMDTSFRISFSEAAGSPDGYIAIRRMNASPTFTPIDGTNYAVGQIAGDGLVAYIGSNFSFVETGLESGIVYYYDIFSYNGNSGSINYLLTSPLEGSQATLVTQPPAQPTNLTFSNITISSFLVSFTEAAGSPDGYIVIRGEGASPTFIPVDGTIYTNGQTVGDGMVAYTGSSFSFNQTGLNSNTVYYYNIFSYNGSGYSRNYLSITPLEGSQTTLQIEPIAQPTNLTFSSITTSSLSVSFTGAAGPPNGYIAIRREDASPTFTPIDGITYSAGQTVGGGTVAYTGSNLTFDETSLSVETNYYYDIFSYNGNAETINYLTTNPLEGNQSTMAAQPTTQPINLSFSNITPSSFLVSFTGATGSPDGYIAIRREGDSPTFVPVDGTNYTTGQTVGDDMVVFTGSTFSFNQTGLNFNTVYYYDIFSYNGSGNLINYLSTSPLEGSQTTLQIEPIAQPTNLTFSSITTSSFSVS
ncbi:MAG: hypothetical protein KAR38_17540, partial [Calditrichia bacterium]|nr:hypothetical protein [Calditrichia bacterium]